MAHPRDFERRLQAGLTADDAVWNYTVRDMPRSEQTNAAGLIKHISVVASYSEDRIVLGFEYLPQSRATSGESLDKFMLISFTNFRLRAPKSPGSNKVQLTTGLESAEYIFRLLKTGVRLNGVHFNFFGHSARQLKSKSCIMFAGTKDHIRTKISGFGDFSAITSVGKLAKRIGLLFSRADAAVRLPESRFEDIEDIISGGYNFTDGCGRMSPTFARQIAQQANVTFRNKRYLPSVFQIRFRGYKGVLALCPDLDSRILVQFRKSMKKFQSSSDPMLAIVSYSKPYSFGFLNDEVILLLESLGVPAVTLLRKQAEYLAFLERAYSGAAHDCFHFLFCMNEHQLAESVLLDGPMSVLPKVQSLVHRECKRTNYKKKHQKCRIMIQKSRLLFGVCDPTAQRGRTGVLEPGTCFLRPTMDDDGMPRTIINTEVLVTRNPCLHPGDLQKFRAVNVPKLSHLVDCIVFPTRGARPSADMMSGGDLDGDLFFVIWDPDLIPSTLSQAALYPAVDLPDTCGHITEEGRIQYFARYNTVSLARMKNLFLDWARCRGPLSAECQQINRLYSQCLDGNDCKVPRGLEEPPKPPEGAKPFVLDVLRDAAKDDIETMFRVTDCFTDSSPELIQLLLSHSRLCISEFELIQYVLKWCVRNKVPFSDNVPFFNLSALNGEQQIWLLGLLPPEERLPAMVRNGLFQSQLIGHTDLRLFRLDSHSQHWRPIFNSAYDRMGRFLSAACQSLEMFHKKLIILRPDERLTLAIYIPQKIPRARTVQVDASVRVLAFPQPHDTESQAHGAVASKVESRLYCDEGVFQLYRRHKGDTFVFLQKSPFNKSAYENIKDAGDRRRKKQGTLDIGANYDFRASIALNKINSHVQKHVGRLNRSGIKAAEIYVISNRDIHSMQVLDEWSNLIDTNEVLPLFKQTHTEEQPAGRTNEAATSAPFGNEAYHMLQMAPRSVEASTMLGDLLRQSIGSGHYARVHEVSQCILDRCYESPSARGLDDVHLLLRNLPDAPYLTFPILQSKAWELYRTQAQGHLSNVAPLLVKRLFAADHSFHGFVCESLRKLLQEIHGLSRQDFVDAVETVALSSKDCGQAFDVFMECIEPEACRLLEGSAIAAEQFARHTFGVALDYVGSINPRKISPEERLKLMHDTSDPGCTLATATVRIDSPIQDLQVWDHVEFHATDRPLVAPAHETITARAVVTHIELGAATFRYLHRVPLSTLERYWEVTYLGCFAKSKSMLDAMISMDDEALQSAAIPNLILHCRRPEQGHARFGSPETTNSEILQAVLKLPLSLIWAPAGTPRLSTIAMLLEALLQRFPNERILVSAPTDTAVDGLLRHFVQQGSHERCDISLFRWAQKSRGVSDDLMQYSCASRDLTRCTNDFSTCNGPRDRLEHSRLVFTSTMDAASEILRTERFETVLIDDATRQVEAASFVPLSRCCSRAILIGDHSIARPSVNRHAAIMGLEISLFERLFDSHTPVPGVAKLMLRTQDIAHPDLTAFRSGEFYGGRLGSTERCNNISLPLSKFPWPDRCRMAFVQCSSAEDLTHQSKCNTGQGSVCREVFELLSSTSAVEMFSKGNEKLAVRTFYARQRDHLRAILPQASVSCVDDCYGQEAEIVILVTVRCNVSASIGDVGDEKHINAAIAGAKAGLVIIGDRATLTSDVNGGKERECKGVWKRLLQHCSNVWPPK